MNGTRKILARRLGLPLAALALWSACGLPAAAQSLRHDGSLPIEITADTLEVVQQDQVATFSGNVDAVQGELVLSADQLRVHYRGADEAGEAAPGTGGTIRRIEAIGNVLLTSPQETAQGEVGEYDVVGNLVTLEGSVVLTREDNVIHGARLELDLTTGRSRVLAAPGVAGGEPGERVRAIFTPSGGTGTQGQPAGGGAPSAGAEPSGQEGTPAGAAAVANEAGPPPPAPRPASAE